MWTRRAVLGGLAAAAAAPARAATPAAKRNLVVILASGGWDVSFALDPKPGDAVHGPQAAPGAGDEDVRTYGGIDVAVNDIRRPGVSGFFDRWWDRTAVVNGVSVGTLSHERSLSRVLSGHWYSRQPDIAAVVGAADPDRPLGMVDLTGHGRFGEFAGRCARWGRQGQARALLDPKAHFASPDRPDDGPWLMPARAEREAVDAWLEERAEALRPSWTRADGMLEAWLDSRRRAVELRDAEPAVGRGLPWGWSATWQGDTELVVELLRRDICRSVLVGTRQHWDTHAKHEAQHGAWDNTFSAVDSLLTRLAEEGLLERTTVLLISEMSRTPTLNLHGGKDHWPWTSFLLTGAGVEGGLQLGGTDSVLRGLTVDPESGEVDPNGVPLEPAMVLAGVAEILGVDPAAVGRSPVMRGFARQG